MEETGIILPQSRNVKSYQKLEEEGLSPISMKRIGAANTGIPQFWTSEQQKNFCLGNQICSKLLWYYLGIQCSKFSSNTVLV